MNDHDQDMKEFNDQIINFENPAFPPHHNIDQILQKLPEKLLKFYQEKIKIDGVDFK